MQNLNTILLQFDIPPGTYEWDFIQAGLINSTYKIYSIGGGNSYLLQQINTNIFTEPERISRNVAIISNYLKHHFPDYLFGHFIPSKTGNTLVVDNGNTWRMQPFFENTYSINTIQTVEQAELTAYEFARFSAMLSNLDSSTLTPAIHDFHNLELRWNQFLAALKSASEERLATAQNEIVTLHNFQHLVGMYTDIVSNKLLPLRIIHADTKINNILFDVATHRPLCIIDYDTIMPGYFISDLGDMLRTMLCIGDENCNDKKQLLIRNDFYHAIIRGYKNGMDGIWSSLEDRYVDYAGQFMTYMQALRFLTDYLNQDIYYKINYETHNLDRAKNQIYFLNQLSSL
ncbi:MAG: phosphotransferase [Bacteroidetes bacterium]|nr:phosphotransferase [Bacteroidota bacterium]